MRVDQTTPLLPSTVLDRAADLTAEQRELLAELATIPGADVWERWDARVCRELEPLKLVRIVKARNAPKDGAMRQPFFGVKITAAGRRALARSEGK